MQTFYPSILFGSPPTQCPLFLLFHLQRLDLQPPHLIYAGINPAELSHLINAGKTRSLSSTVAAVDSPVPPILGSGHRHQILPLVLLAHFNGGAEVVNRPLVSESLARRRRRRAPSGAPRPSSGAGRRLLGHAGHAIIIGDSRSLMVRGS